MAGNVMGGDAAIGLIFMVVALGLFGAWLWSLIDAATRPGWAFDAAGSSKMLWVVLLVLLGGIPGIIYLVSVRQRVQTAQSGGAAGGYPGWQPAGAAGAYPGWQPAQMLAGPGWYPDPVRRHQHRYWDGMHWTDGVSDGGVTGSDPVGADA